MRRLQAGLWAALFLLSPGLGSSQPTYFSGVGGDNTSGGPGTANVAMIAFEAAIGGSNNGSGGSYPNGFRTVYWDDVPDSYAMPNLLPPDYFNKTSKRGVMLITPGLGVAVSAGPGSGYPLNFGNVDPSYTANFAAFSPVRVFSPYGSNIVQIYFYKPGTDLPATVSAFGAIFNDVESGATRMDFFRYDGSLMATTILAPAASGVSQFSGMTLAPDDAPIGHVVITLGSDRLVFNNLEPANDLVVMDDITFAEPRSDALFADGFD